MRGGGVSEIDPAARFAPAVPEPARQVPVPDLVVDSLISNVPVDVASRGEFHRLARLALTPADHPRA
jgi:hypothetical protein